MRRVPVKNSRAVAILVIVAALLELYFPPSDWLARLAVVALAVTGAVLSCLALVHARGVVPRPAETAVGAQIHPRTDGHAPTHGKRQDPVPLLFSRQPPAPAGDSPGLAPPRVGRGSKAQALPWLLPAHTVYPGIVADEARLGDLAVRAASVVGPGHRCEEPVTPRQDAYRLGRDESRRHLIVAVADGVSSSRFAELGATVAASAAVNILRERLSHSPDPAALAASDVFCGVAAQMADAAASRSLGNSDICAALVTAVIPAGPVPGDEPRQMWVAWVGDASVWTVRDGAWTFVAGDHKRASGGLESNAVAHALPDSPLTVTTTNIGLAPGAVVALVTDGVGDVLATLGEANQYFTRNWARPPSSTSFVNDVGYDAERFIDDRTAVAVWVGTDSTNSTEPRR
ncbi:MAG TPA: protein phosphatase 2C domain-containing protein [Amycolatopsis sp.]|nr:protein phosphatase 2C domain-containing protein [Amycolatopsis sp.]